MSIKNLDKFSPLYWLSSLGAGGTAVAFFAFFNYVFEHGKGLVKMSQIHGQFGEHSSWLLISLELLMAIFIILHFVLTIKLVPKTIAWLRTGAYKDFINDPLRNSAILAPFISLTMTMNVLIGPIRYFFPLLSDNLQLMMLPGLIVWALLWIVIMRLVINLLVLSFNKGFDLSKVNFGWLLQPFSLAMLTVTGTGIAAMANDFTIANIAAFMSLISGTMSFFLFAIKLPTVFKSHFANDSLPDKQFLPSILVIVPHITLYAISLFRIGHFLEHHHNAHLGAYFMIVMIVAFAFEIWYLMFGIALLRNYFKTHLTNEFHVSQWALICPFVAYGVLAAFVYPLFAPVIAFFWFIISIYIFVSLLFFFVLYKQYLCSRKASSPMNLKSGLQCA